MKVEDITPENIRLGLEVSFVPVAWAVDLSSSSESKTRPRKRIPGRIVYINRRHRHFGVRAAAGYIEGFKY